MLHDFKPKSIYGFEIVIFKLTALSLIIKFYIYLTYK